MFTGPELEQLFFYLRGIEASGEYAGDKALFQRRHEQIKEKLYEAMDRLNSSRGMNSRPLSEKNDG